MTTVLHALGFTKMMSEIIESLLNGRVPSVVLRGRSGTGKTSLAKAVAERLSHSNFDVLSLRGDSGRRSQEYYPFYNLLRARAANPGAPGVIGAVADQLPGPLAAMRRAVDIVGNFVDARSLASQTIVHDPVSTEILTLLRSRLKRGKLLLVLDDVQAFDSATIGLLDLIISAPEQCLGSHGSRLHILATQNDDDRQNEVELVREKVLQRFRPYILSRCSFRQFPELLRAIGFSSHLQPDVLNELYLRSGAHLRVVAELARHVGPHTQVIDIHSDRRLLDIALTLRLTEPAVVGSGIDRLVARIAILGASFTRVELHCLLDDVPAADIPVLIRKCLDLELFDSEGQNLSFQHGAIHDFFLRIAPQEHPRYHATVANCLRLLRPSDYAARASHLEAAGNLNEADLLRVLSWARASRSGRNSAIPSFASLDSEYTRGLRSAHESMQAGQDGEAAVVLESMHDSYPALLLAERDITLAECYLEDVSKASFRRALDLLNRWSDSLSDELELRSRMLYLRAMALTLTAEYTSASHEVTTLERILAPVRATDPGLQRLLNRVQVVSDGLHSIEVANRRISSAVTSLLAARTEARAFNPIDLYVALTNYSGNLLIYGDYGSAARHAAVVGQLRSEYPEFQFPSHLPALNNQLLAEMLDNQVSVPETASAFEALIGSVGEVQDHLLLAVNYANLLCMTGKSAQVPDLIHGLLHRAERDGECDDYYIYYLKHALATAVLLNGRRGEAQHLWASIASLHPKLPPGVQRYLYRRHELLGSAVADPTVRSAGEWQTHMHRVPDFEGPAWRFFRNGFLFSDIQLWLQL